MEAQDLAKAQLAKLVEEGREILRAAGWSGDDPDRRPGEHEYLRLRTEAMNHIRQSCGQDSNHYREINGLAVAAYA